MTKHDKEDLEELMKQATSGLTETTELGEVTKEFNRNTPSASNLTSDEMRLVWRGKNILKHMSPESAEMIDEFIDLKRSVKGWNTDKKVDAISGIREGRSGGNMMNTLFGGKK